MKWGWLKSYGYHRTGGITIYEPPYFGHQCTRLLTPKFHWDHPAKSLPLESWIHHSGEKKRCWVVEIDDFLCDQSVMVIISGDISPYINHQYHIYIFFWWYDIRWYFWCRPAMKHWNTLNLISAQPYRKRRIYGWCQVGEAFLHHNGVECVRIPDMTENVI